MNPNTTRKLIKVWKLQATNSTGETREIRAATIEQGERKPNPMCEGCYAECCRSPNAILTSEEFLFKKFKHTFIQADAELHEGAPEGKGGFLIVVIPKQDGHCWYFDPKQRKCKTWPDIPKACLAYDCRDDNRPEIQTCCQQRTQEWAAQQGR